MSTPDAPLEADPPAAPPRPVLKFMGRTEVAHYLGMRSIKSLAKVKLPPHDAEIGGRKGWMPGTIDRWQSQRPGRGWHGARVGRTRTGMNRAEPLKAV